VYAVRERKRTNVSQLENTLMRNTDGYRSTMTQAENCGEYHCNVM